MDGNRLRFAVRMAGAAIGIASFCGAPGVANASLSLGKKGTVIKGVGSMLPGNGSGFVVKDAATGFHGSINCDRIDMSGTLNGGATQPMDAVFSGCRGTQLGTSGANEPATVTFAKPQPTWPNLILYLQTANSEHKGIVYIKAVRMTITSGSCTITPGGGTYQDLVARPNYGSGVWNAYQDKMQILFPYGSTYEPSSYPGYPHGYTGSAGCLPQWRGVHTSGFGVGRWEQSLPGLLPTYVNDAPPN